MNKLKPKKNPIGIFDSGIGGLSILKGLLFELPNFDYIYLGDNHNAPYGDKSTEEIYQLTLKSVEYLFNRGCPLVILACNTASAVALRKIQQKILPEKYPNNKVLGILIPSIEEITKSKNKHLGILATTQTVKSKVYLEEIEKVDPSIKVTQLACPRLVPMIESATPKENINQAIQTYLDQLPLNKLDSLLLGCTHYEIIAKQIQARLPKNIKVYKQPEITAKRLKEYILNHPELNLSQNASRELLCTGNSNFTQKLATKFLKNKVHFRRIKP